MVAKQLVRDVQRPLLMPQHQVIEGGFIAGLQSGFARLWLEPALRIGDEIPYESVSRVLRVEINSERFYTVTRNWRNRMQERGLVIECRPGRCFSRRFFPYFRGQ